MTPGKRSLILTCLVLLCAALPAYAQQTGLIRGKVTATDGSVLPGVTVEARSSVLPGPRSTVTQSNGEYQLPALPPGDYSVVFSLSKMQSVTRKAAVQLGQETVADVQLSIETVKEDVVVTAASSVVDRDSAQISSGISSETIKTIPVGQEYRDLIKLLPGVQYTQDATRGPSAGGSGQDNVYNFDGVNVTLPLFGTLSAEPAAHDVSQVTMIKGGARAVDFDRAGGFTMDSISKTGTNKLTGMISYQFQQDGMAAELTNKSLTKYNQDRAWTEFNGGGPILPNRVFFYGSYYRPNLARDNVANLYGDLPAYDSTRNEGFGKVTVNPGHSILINATLRKSHRLETGDIFPSNAASTTGSGNESWLTVGTGEASWVIDPESYLTFRLTHFASKNQSRPDNVVTSQISTAVGTKLDLNSLETLGLFSVPSIISGQTAYNAFVQPYIDKYGFIRDGVKTGGGSVGYGNEFNKQDFFRDGWQVGYNRSLVTGMIRHDFHAGYQRFTDSEDLQRSSNGWGTITIPGGRLNFQGTPIFYETTFSQQSSGLPNPVPLIHSEYQSQSFEVNDTIRFKDWVFNAGLLASNDNLFGQGLREDASTLSGYVKSPGTKYKEYEIPFSKMIQPRVSATYAYDHINTVFVGYAKYNPAASSLPRAASWDRNLATTINAYFDTNGVLFAIDPVASSSGKLFVENMTPRGVNEIVYGTARQFGRHMNGRIYGRYRESKHFWEDTNNNARVVFNPPPGIPQTLYIPDLADRLAQIGSGSTYVITELDGAYTKYYETTLESDYRKGAVYVRGTYTYSKYYGNFDQDNSSLTNDQAIFIGSSNIGDGAGRQLWDLKDGTLRGDRPHVFKVYGSYSLPWNATTGAYFIAQSGQAWEAWSYEPYKALTTSTSDTDRYLEPAGSRRTESHWQIDLNYIQNVKVNSRFTAQIAVDGFNLTNNQTGYNYQPSVHATTTFDKPRTYYSPRYGQVAFRLLF